MDVLLYITFEDKKNPNMRGNTILSGVGNYNVKRQQNFGTAPCVTQFLFHFFATANISLDVNRRLITLLDD
jgi:hypothetical protein